MNRPILLLAISLICRVSSADVGIPPPPDSEARESETEESLAVAPALEALGTLPSLKPGLGSYETLLDPTVTTTPVPIGFSRPERTIQPRFEWKEATADSLRFLVLQTAARIAVQAKTRRGLGGPFVGGYVETVRARPEAFMDGDLFLTNFIGHPVQGSVAYHLARVNGGSRQHAFWWGVAYSTQFELGPVGEASIGNVPISLVDLMVTPTAGFLLGLAEESLLVKINGIKNPTLRGILRLTLVGRSLTRLVSGK